MASTDENPRAEVYRDSLQKLLPAGRIWNRKPGGPRDNLLLGLGNEFAHIDDRVLALLQEFDPHTTADLLEDWERVAGLPDPCLPTPPTTTRSA